MMFRMIRAVLAITGLAAIGLGAIAAESGPSMGTPLSSQFTNLFPDKVVARGKGFQITRTQVDDAFIAFKASLATQGQSVPENRRSEVEARVLERLINVQALQSKATADDKTRAKEEAEKHCTEYRQRFPDDAAFKRQLIALGMPEEKFRQSMFDECLFRLIIDREVRVKVKITDNQVKKYYDEHPSDFDQPETVQFSQILVLTQDPSTRMDLPEAQKLEKKKLAEKALARLKSGEAFAKVAKEMSDDPIFSERGGEMPPLAHAAMAPELEKIAFSITLNKVSDIITTKVGYHIIKVNERKGARKISLSESMEKLREFLSVQETQKLLPDYLAKLRAELGVEILDKPAK